MIIYPIMIIVLLSMYISLTVCRFKKASVRDYVKVAKKFNYGWKWCISLVVMFSIAYFGIFRGNSEHYLLAAVTCVMFGLVIIYDRVFGRYVYVSNKGVFFPYSYISNKKVKYRLDGDMLLLYRENVKEPDRLFVLDEGEKLEVLLASGYFLK